MFLIFLLVWAVSLDGQNSTAPTAPQASPAVPSDQPATPPATQSPPSGQNPTNSPSKNPPAGAQQGPPGQAPGAQSPGRPPSATENGVFVFHAEAQEVTLHATVVDEKNHLVMNLNKTDFKIFENDQPQQIRSFRHEDIPVAMGILIDNSGSMREKRAEVNRAALNLVKASNPDDQVFVVNFNDEPILDQEFTSDVKKLQAALEHVEARGGTALYDAVVASWNDQLKNAKLQRKVLFLVTDGEDNASQAKLEDTIHLLQQENGPAVYCIGLFGQEKSRRAKRALQTIAERTGGIPFFPPTLEQVDEISRNIAHDIRNQYTITYTPTTPKNVTGFRTIHVDAHAQHYKKLTVRTRSGYYPGQEQQGVGGGN